MVGDNEEGATALFSAAEEGNTAALRGLLQQGDARKTLTIALSFPCCAAVAAFLKKRGVLRFRRER